jgi:RNA polymerase sigma-70 factor (ECF subfamily)
MNSRVLPLSATVSPVNEPSSDAQLLARARHGDDDAFRRLVERYEPVIAATVIGMLGAGDDADDVGQETFIRFHRALAVFREESTLKTYLVRIAMNLSLNALKSRRRSNWRFLSRDRDDVPVAVAPSPAVPSDEMQERRDIVVRAVQGLGEKHRAVVTLRLLQGLSVRETAEVLSLPEGTVLSRLARASEQLRTLLGPYLKEGVIHGARQ